MRPETQQGNRRRRGGRRHRGPRSGSSSASSPRGSSSGSSRRSGSSEKAPEKLGFFQRIIAFFTGKKPVSRPVPGNVYGRVITDTPAPSSRSNGQSSRPASTPATSASESRANENQGSEATAPKPSRPARKPELVEVTSPKLYVGNLSFDASESDLSELFSGVGQVQSSEVVCHRETHRSKGFAFITMCTVEEARRAVDELHDKEYMGRRLVVSGAKTSDAR